jgi:hypothetical protein
MTRRQKTTYIAKTWIALAFIVIFPSTLCSQDLRTALPKHIAKTLSLSPPEGSKLFPLDQPVSIGSISIKGSSEKSNMSLWTVPTVNQENLVILSSTPLSEVMQSYFSKIQDFELGYVSLSTEQQERLKKAQEVLYSDPGADMPSKKLARFRKWKTDREKLLEEIRAASNDVAKQLSLNQRLQTVDQDYRLIGEKEQVEAALEIVDRSASQARLFQPQLEQLKTQNSANTQIASCRRLFETVSSSSGWVRVTLDAKTLQELSATEAILNIQGGQNKKFSLSLKSISFQVLLAKIEQPSLAGDIMGNRAWRRKDKRVLSLGGAENDSNELLPRYVSDALVLRDLDMYFESNPNYAGFSEAMDTSSAGAIGGLPLRFSSSGSSYSIIDHIYIPSPIIVAVIVTRTQKVPNQAPDLNWK